MEIGSLSLILIVGLLILISIGVPMGFASGFMGAVLVFLYNGEHGLGILLSIHKASPVNFDALYLLGIISFHLKEYQQSFKFLDKAIIINSNIPDLYNIYSLVLCQVNNFKEALKYLDKAIDIKPD